MKTPAPPLLPIFRSDTQAKLLAYLFLRADERLPLSQVAAKLGLHPATVVREVNRLESCEMVTVSRVGYAKIAVPNENSPYYDALSSLLLRAFGPLERIRDALRDVEGIEESYIFGSWADRYLGTPGHHPNDIDVLLVGRVNRLEIAKKVVPIERELGLEVNPIVISQEDWEQTTDGFYFSIKNGPLVSLQERS